MVTIEENGVPTVPSQAPSDPAGKPSLPIQHRSCSSQSGFTGEAYARQSSSARPWQSSLSLKHPPVANDSFRWEQGLTLVGKKLEGGHAAQGRRLEMRTQVQSRGWALLQRLNRVGRAGACAGKGGGKAVYDASLGAGVHLGEYGERERGGALGEAGERACAPAPRTRTSSDSSAG